MIRDQLIQQVIIPLVLVLTTKSLVENIVSVLLKNQVDFWSANLAMNEEWSQYSCPSMDSRLLFYLCCSPASDDTTQILRSSFELNWIACTMRTDVLLIDRLSVCCVNGVIRSPNEREVFALSEDRFVNKGERLDWESQLICSTHVGWMYGSHRRIGERRIEFAKSQDRNARISCERKWDILLKSSSLLSWFVLWWC